MNRTQFEILTYLQAHPDTPISKISADLKLNICTTQRNMRELMAASLVHISSYHPRMHGSGKVPPAYTAGPGENATKRKPKHETQHKRKIEQQREKRRLASIAKRADGSVFGLMVAQMTVEKRV